MAVEDEKLFRSFVTHLAGMKDHQMNKAMGGKLIGCLVITDHVDTGYCIAYESGCNHRLSKEHWAWRAVHSNSLQVVTAGSDNGWSPCQSVPMTPGEAKREVKPWNLGCATEPLFDHFINVTYPDVALFVYPGNDLVPYMEREFVDRLSQRDDFGIAIIITKSPVILSDFLGDFIWVVTKVGEHDLQHHI